MNYRVAEITKGEALEMIREYHYSNSLPKLNKRFLGFFEGGALKGVVTLGWGVRPMHTIKRMFPSLGTADYYEIGRMCMTEDMPRNSESMMLSDLAKWIKANEPGIKVLLTWADGMLGKVGYVYQASGFIYAGYSKGEMYLKSGVKIHVRQTKSLFRTDANDRRKTVRPTLAQMREAGIEHYVGRQYAYVRFMCGKVEKKRLIAECLVPLDLPNPKDADLRWKRKNLETGKWEDCGKPGYRTDFDQSSKDEALGNGTRQMSLFDFM